MTHKTDGRYDVTLVSSGHDLAKIEPGHYMGEFGLVKVFFTCTNIYGEEWSAYVFDLDSDDLEVVYYAGTFPALRKAVAWAKQKLLPEPDDDIIEAMGGYYERERRRLDERTDEVIDNTLPSRTGNT